MVYLYIYIQICVTPKAMQSEWIQIGIIFLNNINFLFNIFHVYFGYNKYYNSANISMLFNILK